MLTAKDKTALQSDSWAISTRKFQDGAIVLTPEEEAAAAAQQTTEVPADPAIATTIPAPADNVDSLPSTPATDLDRLIEPSLMEIDYSAYNDADQTYIRGMVDSGMVKQDAIDKVGVERALHIMTQPDDFDYHGGPGARVSLNVNTNALRDAIDADGGLTDDQKYKYKRVNNFIAKVKNNNLKIIKADDGRYWIEGINNEGEKEYSVNGVWEIKQFLDRYQEDVETIVRVPETVIEDDGSNAGENTSKDTPIVTPGDKAIPAGVPDEFSDSDIWQLRALGTDGVSTIAALIAKATGVGAPVGIATSVVGGLIATAMSGYGDYINEDVSAYEMSKNIGIRLGLEAAEAVTFAPVSLLKNFAKGSHASQIFGKVIRNGVRYGMGAAAISSVVGTDWTDLLDKMGDENKTLTLDDWREVSNMLTYAMTFGAASMTGRKMRRAVNKTTKEAQFDPKTEIGKENLKGVGKVDADVNAVTLKRSGIRPEQKKPVVDYSNNAAKDPDFVVQKKAADTDFEKSKTKATKKSVKEQKAVAKETKAEIAKTEAEVKAITDARTKIANDHKAAIAALPKTKKGALTAAGRKQQTALKAAKRKALTANTKEQKTQAVAAAERTKKLGARGEAAKKLETSAHSTAVAARDIRVAGNKAGSDVRLKARSAETEAEFTHRSAFGEKAADVTKAKARKKAGYDETVATKTESTLEKATKAQAELNKKTVTAQESLEKLKKKKVKKGEKGYDEYKAKKKAADEAVEEAKKIAAEGQIALTKAKSITNRAGEAVKSNWQKLGAKRKNIGAQIDRVSAAITPNTPLYSRLGVANMTRSNMIQGSRFDDPEMPELKRLLKETYKYTGDLDKYTYKQLLAVYKKEKIAEAKEKQKISDALKAGRSGEVEKKQIGGVLLIPRGVPMFQDGSIMTRSVEDRAWQNPYKKDPVKSSIPAVGLPGGWLARIVAKTTNFFDPTPGEVAFKKAEEYRLKEQTARLRARNTPNAVNGPFLDPAETTPRPLTEEQAAVQTKNTQESDAEAALRKQAALDKLEKQRVEALKVIAVETEKTKHILESTGPDDVLAAQREQERLAAEEKAKIHAEYLRMKALLEQDKPVGNDVAGMFSTFLKYIKPSDFFDRSRIFTSLPSHIQTSAPQETSMTLRGLPGAHKAITNALNIAYYTGSADGNSQVAKLGAFNAGHKRAEEIQTQNRQKEDSILTENEAIASRNALRRTQQANQDNLTNTGALDKYKLSLREQQAKQYAQQTQRTGRLLNGVTAGVHDIYNKTLMSNAQNKYNTRSEAASKWNQYYNPRYTQLMTDGKTSEAEALMTEYMKETNTDPLANQKAMNEQTNEFNKASERLISHSSSTLNT